jgi:hypothetical protein
MEMLKVLFHWLSRSNDCLRLTSLTLSYSEEPSSPPPRARSRRGLRFSVPNLMESSASNQSIFLFFLLRSLYNRSLGFGSSTIGNSYWLRYAIHTMLCLEALLNDGYTLCYACNDMSCCVSRCAGRHCFNAAPDIAALSGGRLSRLAVAVALSALLCMRCYALCCTGSVV